jgi:hypothetical protein
MSSVPARFPERHGSADVELRVASLLLFLQVFIIWLAMTLWKHEDYAAASAVTRVLFPAPGAAGASRKAEPSAREGDR